MSAEREQRRTRAASRWARRGEAGITLLLMTFFAALMIIAAAVAVPNLILQERRQQEKLMIWRGRQYARAIGLYFRKTGHFPHDLKQLEKGVGNVHFLRKAYKNPMSSDGSWRLIYLGAGGQLTGSLCWQTLAQYQAAEMGVPILSPRKTTGTTAGQTAFFDSETGKSKKPTVPTCEMIGQNPSSFLHAQTIMEGDMVGGNLIGVGGVTNAPSIKHYMGADNYRYWEFIWSPAKNQQKLLPGASPATGKGKPGSSKKPTKPTKPGSSPTSSPAPPQSPNNQSSSF